MKQPIMTSCFSPVAPFANKVVHTLLSRELLGPPSSDVWVDPLACDQPRTTSSRPASNPGMGREAMAHGANQYTRPREISRFPLRECSVCPTGFHKRNRNPKKSTLGEGVAVLGIAHGDRRLRQGCLCRSWTPCGNGESCGCAPSGSQVCGVLARGREVMWPHVTATAGLLRVLTRSGQVGSSAGRVTAGRLWEADAVACLPAASFEVL